MATVNTVFLSGNLTSDPELRYITTGTAILTFALAVHRNFKHGDEWKKETTFVDCKAWGTTAERAAEHMTKRAEVAIAGRLQQESWQAADGTPRSKLLVIADRVDVINGGKKA